MLRNILLGLYFWILMVLTIIVYLPYLLLRLISETATNGYLRFLIRGWSRHILNVAGVKLDVQGLDNLPATRKLAVVSNHQSYFDIPVLIVVMPFLLGFVAKKELGRIPIVNLWIGAMGCVLIDRKQPGRSLEKIRRRFAKAEKGYPVVLFPEGTRSRGACMGRFKTGSLQMLFSSDLQIVPVSISGSYRLLEEHNSLKKGTVRVTIHPPVTGHKEDEKNPKELVEQLRETIRSGLDLEESL